VLCQLKRHTVLCIIISILFCSYSACLLCLAGCLISQILCSSSTTVLSTLWPDTTFTPCSRQDNSATPQLYLSVPHSSTPPSLHSLLYNTLFSHSLYDHSYRLRCSSSGERIWLFPLPPWSPPVARFQRFCFAPTTNNSSSPSDTTDIRSLGAVYILIY
jgi:hypothetical protein